MDAPNLTVLTGTRARRLLFEGGRCVGVETDGGEVRAEHEVVVCAGAIDSPKLLMLSGIGRADALARLGIEVVVDLPGVGENLHDHLLAPGRLLVDASGAAGRAGDAGRMHAHLFDAEQGRVCPYPTRSRSSSTYPRTSPGWKGRRTRTR